MVKVNHVQLPSNNRDTIKLIALLLTQTIVEYGFLIKIENIINYHPDLYRCHKITTFRELFEQVSPSIRCPNKTDQETTTISHPISTYFNEYIISPVAVTLPKINEMLKYLEHRYNTGDYAVAYYNLLVRQKCQGDKIYRNFVKKEFRSVYDAKNYSIWYLNKKLHSSAIDYNTYTYLVYTQDEDLGVDPTLAQVQDNENNKKQYNFITSHVFVHYYNQTEIFEVISIQLALSHLASALCLQAKSGLSVTLFNYIMDEIVVKRAEAKLIYAQAWPKMSNILTQKFDFSTLNYDSGILVLKENKGRNVSILRLVNDYLRYELTDPRYHVICSNNSEYTPDSKLLKLLSDNWRAIKNTIHDIGEDYLFTFKVLDNQAPNYENYNDYEDHYGY